MQIISPSHNRLRAKLRASPQWGFMTFKKLLKRVKLEHSFIFGTRYQYGKDVAKDDKQAFAWFKTAADQGLSPAQLNVGRMYADGIGVKKDELWLVNISKKRQVTAITVQAYNLAMMEEQKEKLRRCLPVV